MLLFSLPQGLNAQGVVLELDASVVTAQANPVKTVGDTVVFSPAAYSLEDDAMLEDFLKKIPGLEYDGRSITLYGRKISSLLVNGRLYFGGDLVAGLKNISAESIEEVRTFERQSDFSRISGIDDGEGVPVLDVRIKKKFMDAWRGDTRASAGLTARYRGVFNMNKITDTSRITLMGNVGNIPAASTISRTGLDSRGSGSRGESDARSAGAEYNIKKRKLELDANINWTGGNAFTETESETENVHAKGSNFVLGQTESLSRNDKIIAESSLEWRPRKDITVLAKPHFTFTDNGRWSNPVTSTYGDYPVDGLAALNTINQSSSVFRRQSNGRIVLQFTHRLPKKGRNLTARFGGSLSGGDSYNYNDYMAFYNKKTTVRKQFYSMPWFAGEYSLQLSYNEPLGKGLHAQLTVNGRFVSHNLDREFYSMQDFFEWQLPRSISRSDAFSSLPSGYETSLDKGLSSSGSYNGILLTGTAGLKYVRKKINLTAGVSIKPVWSRVSYCTTDSPNGKSSSYICYAAPNISLRYNRSKREFWAFNYRSNISTPNPGNLIPLRSGTNPLSVRIGNPDLKPSFIQTLGLTYNYSRPGRGNSLVCELSAKSVDNAYTTSTEYFPETGAREARMCNISGNHSLQGSLAWNHAFKGTPISLGNTLSGGYFKDNTYLYNTKSKEDELNTMLRFDAKELMVLTAKWRTFDMSARLGGEYSSAKSLLRSDFAEDPYALRAGIEASKRFPGKWRVSSELGYVYNDGFLFDSLNGSYYIWNASVSKTVFSGKGTLRLEASDIPGVQTNMTHRFSGMTIGATTWNGDQRYVILIFVYRFKSK